MLGEKQCLNSTAFLGGSPSNSGEFPPEKAFTPALHKVKACGSFWISLYRKAPLEPLDNVKCASLVLVPLVARLDQENDTSENFQMASRCLAAAIEGKASLYKYRFFVFHPHYRHGHTLDNKSGKTSYAVSTL